MRKVILFFMLIATLAVNAQTKSAVQEVRDYLHDCGIFYIATVDGDQPRVRPFGVAEVYNGKLYIQTGKKKNVFNILVLQNWLERIRKEVTNKVHSIKRISDFLIFPILAQPTLKKI